MEIEIKKTYGVGVNTKGKYPGYKSGKITKEYALWMGMLERCYSKKYQSKYPTYTECTVSENFKDFQYFAEWCNNQTGFGNQNWQLDKDILIKGNKFYSEDTCCFVPRELNYLLTDRINARGNWPVGVYLHKATNKFLAQLNKGNGENTYLGVFATPEAAHLAYKIAKQEFIKEQAQRYKEMIDNRVYNSLLNWRIEQEGELQTVFFNGQLVRETSLSTIRSQLWG